MMHLIDNRLVGVDFRPDNMGGPLKPEYLLIHYTATRHGPATIRSLQHESMKASVHFVVEPDGKITQMVPCNRVAWHAGKSRWEGRDSCSSFMLGIEVVNPGPIRADRTTLVVEWDPAKNRPYPHAKPWTGGVVEATHKNGRCPYRFWCEYPEAQLAALTELSRLLVRAYALKDVVGHDDVAPERKIDPGPAFPMESFRAAVMAAEEQ